MTSILPTGHVVTRDGVALFRRDIGEGPAVVFLSSWSLPSDSWFVQMQALSAEFPLGTAVKFQQDGTFSEIGKALDGTISVLNDRPSGTSSQSGILDRASVAGFSPTIIPMRQHLRTCQETSVCIKLGEAS